MKNIIIVWLVVSFPLLATSQQIKGQVTGNEGGEMLPIPGVNVVWKKDGSGTVTDAKGKYKIEIPNLPDTLQVSAVGFETQYLLIDTIYSKIDIELKEKDRELDEVVIEVRRPDKSISKILPIGVETMNSGELTKAACCNLSESFETNATVDVNMTDAVSGAKKIQMLGLDGVYTQLQYENIPFVRGLAASNGISFVPGTWAESIQITKGAGSVVNGYETITGLINVEFLKPDGDQAFFLNGYANRFGRAELNTHVAYEFNDKWSTMLFAHGSAVKFETDENRDGFLDVPLSEQLNVFNRWKYEGDNYMAQFGVRAYHNNAISGQVDGMQAENTLPYEVNMTNQLGEIFFKNGWIFKNRPAASLALVSNFKMQKIDNQFGLRNYSGTENRGYANIIYSDILGNTLHKYKTGISFLYDDFQQAYNDSSFNRTEIVPGAYFEYTYNNISNFSWVMGGRYDYHNLFGHLVSPRTHLRYNPDEKTVLRLMAGRGYRVANPLADNAAFLASSRQLIVTENLLPEDAISTGVTASRTFTLFDWDANLTVDYYYTHFLNQIVMDRDIDPGVIQISNLNGQSFSHAVQIEGDIEPIERLEIRAAYKFYDVQVTMGGELQQRPFVPKNRALVNVAYETRNRRWKFDVTNNWVGIKRIPHTHNNPEEYQLPEESRQFSLLHAQITHVFKKWELYLGGENLLNFRQMDPILAADDPYGEHFDASMVWGPITGANVYIGFRWNIDKKNKK